MLVSEDELAFAMGVPVVFARHILARVRALQHRETPPDWDGAEVLRARIAHAATHPDDAPLLLAPLHEPADIYPPEHIVRSPRRCFGRKGL